MKYIKSIIEEVLGNNLQPNERIDFNYDGAYFNFLMPSTNIIFLSELGEIQKLQMDIENDTKGKISMYIGSIEVIDGKLCYSTSFEYEEEDSGEQIDDIFIIEKILNQYGYSFGI